jgi:hypothetical protein
MIPQRAAPGTFVAWIYPKGGRGGATLEWLAVSLQLHQERSAYADPATWPGQPRCLPICGDAVPKRSNQMSPYRTVNYLAYRVSVSASAAGNYAREAASLASGISLLEIAGGPDHYALVVPEIRAQADRAEAAAARARRALDSCWAIARKDPRGPVIRLSDGSNVLFPEDDGARAAIGRCFEQAQSGRAEAHLALDIARALCDSVAGFGQARRPA